MEGERVWIVDDRVMPPVVLDAVVLRVEVGAMYVFDPDQTRGIRWAHASHTWAYRQQADDRAKAIHRLQVKDLVDAGRMG